MKYLCAIYINEQKLNTMTKDEYNGVVQACFNYEEDVKKEGKLLAAEALEPVNTATTVRNQAGKPSVTDGPFAETKEQLAGFFMVDADNLDDAIRIASGMPQARIGSIEVRPIKNLYEDIRT